MQQFQNYYQTQMPTYQGSYQQPMMNMSYPYLDRLTQLQQYQQSLNTFSALGKIVESEDIVKTTDIPMDGNMYYFPKADGTEVYGKKWLPNGQTQILAFKPLLDSETNNLTLEEEKLKFDTFKAFLEGIQEDIKTLNDKVDKLSKPNRAKKEVLEDE